MSDYEYQSKHGYEDGKSPSQVRREKLKKKKEREMKHAERFGNSIRIAVMTIFILGVALFLIFGKRPKVSTEENRNLAKFPKFSFSSYFSGDFTSGVSNFYDDTVPLRSKFKKIGRAHV